MAKPRETLQRAGKAAIEEALGPDEVTRPIRHRHTVWPSTGSSSAAIMFRAVIASQHGVPGSGSGVP